MSEERTRIIVENVFVHQAERKLFNQPELKDIDFIYKGEVVEMDQEEIDYWTYTGLNNVDFITMRMWDEIINEPKEDPKDPCPSTLDDAVNYIMVQLTPANIQDIKAEDLEFSGICLNGMHIRNEWNLWFESPLSLWFAEHGIYHADDMSGTIAKSVWCKVNNTPFDFDGEVEYYQKYWADANCDVKSEFEERCKNKD